ncbi:MAG: DPP IV N-terminal domain-containing protein [Saprospiraceae bacterium]|nr:DPP IV N-terminal domain-containing protein [Saprospiraceae bacterium]
MNRHQNNLKLYISDIKSGKSSIIYEETNKYYIDMSDDLTFLRDGNTLYGHLKRRVQPDISHGHGWYTKSQAHHWVI